MVPDWSTRGGVMPERFTERLEVEGLRAMGIHQSVGAAADHDLEPLVPTAIATGALSKMGIIRNLPPVFFASLSSMYGSV